MISLLGRSQQIIQTGESCYFAFDQEIEESPLNIGKHISSRFQELEKQRKCLYLNQDENDWECMKIRNDYMTNPSLIDVTVGSNSSVAPAFSRINKNICKDTQIRLRSEKWYERHICSLMTTLLYMNTLYAYFINVSI